MTVIGVLYGYNSRSAAGKMKQLRKKSYSKRELRAQFRKYDEDGSGELDFDEFHKLLGDLSIDIGRSEAEVLFLRADRDVLHGINFEEFQLFWEECEKL